MTKPRRYAIGVGSNIEPRDCYLIRALAALERLPTSQVLATSRVWRTAGWGRADLDPFLNAVVAIESALDPHQLLAELRRIEDANGRQRHLHWGPRTLDLDLLAAELETVDSPTLQIPHPWIRKRPFVYLPWRDVVGVLPAWETLFRPPDPAALADEAQCEPLAVSPDGYGRTEPPRADVTIGIPREESMLAFFSALAAGLQPNDAIFLNGPMGAGKSVAARGIARGLRIQGPIQSPTFTLCRRYEQPNLLFEHWDLYRLGSVDDLESTGFFSIEVNRIRVIEWAELFPHDLGAPLLQVTIAPLDDDSRRLTLRAGRGALPFTVIGLVERMRREGIIE